MSALAEIMLELGHRVQGSDREASAVTAYLQKQGGKVIIGHNAANVNGADVLIYSSAVKPSNPERAEAQKRGIAQMRRAELLGLLMQKKRGIAVAGTHGKTTTTAMIARLLLEAGLDPTVLVGGTMRDLGSNAHLGKGEFLVAEADEYDRSFLTLFPEITVITSLEADHLDIYRDMDDLRETYGKFAAQTAFDGLIIRCADDQEVKKMQIDSPAQSVFYAIDDEARIEARNAFFEGAACGYDLFLDGDKVTAVKLQVPGKHNILNSLAAAAVGLQLDLDGATIARGLQSFAGVQRRFEIKGKLGTAVLADDYAHHPTEVWRTLEAARLAGYKKVGVAFQPHLFSRTRDFYKEFASALSLADAVVLAPIYPAREEPIAGVTSALIADELKRAKSAARVVLVEQNAAIAAEIKELGRDMELVLTMGAGDIWRYGESALETIAEK